ncbi:MAG: phosphoenolpyruvate--protein phosphotransferase [Gemmatimonadetes bacterium]|nr:phosphoenolpyruvate--protein phosphotransferase [Gemmatimonadota bacterium]
MIVLEGSPASEGIGVGVVRLLSWRVPQVPSGVIDEGSTTEEIERFEEALRFARERLVAVKEDVDERLGSVEARIFDPQLLMLDDPQVVEGTREYIANHRMTAARAFDWRMLELKEQWANTSHPMVLDRLNDLEDLKVRVLNRLLRIPDPWTFDAQEPVVVVAKDLTPSFAARVDPHVVVALATDEGTRTSHWAILARSLQIPAAVGLGDLTTRCGDGQSLIVDGRTGRVVVDPDDEERQRYDRRRSTILEWADSIHLIASQEAVTRDRQSIALRANLDLPGEAEKAQRYGAEGVGLLRTEFLVVGRSSMPGEEEQYEAYKHVANAFPGHAVIIRTFDLGGDKFPIFLHMTREENPFLGWRGVRVCLDQPELFMPQLRACLRATAHGDVRIMVPMVNTVGEIQAVREMLNTAAEQLRSEGRPFNRGVKLGTMVETPAAALKATELAQHVDFFSIGTNDLVQYTLAVDRTNTRLAHLYDPFHPAVLRQISLVARAGRSAGIEVSVCGELAGQPLGAVLLMGLDILALSVAWPSLPEIKKLIRELRIEDVRQAASEALHASTADGVKAALIDAIGGSPGLAHNSHR